MNSNLKKALLLFSISGFCLFSGAQTVDSVIAKYITFTGGEQRWKTVQTVISSGTYTYGGISFPFTTYSKRPDYYKFVVPYKGKYFAQAFDGKNGWKIDAFKGETKKTILSGTPARALANEADVELENPFINYLQKGHQALLQGQDTIGGTTCFKVQLTRKSGAVETYYFNSQTYGLLKKTALSKNAELENAALDTYYSDYRTVNGLVLPFKSVSKLNGQTILSIAITKVQFNTPIPEAAFKP